MCQGFGMIVTKSLKGYFTTPDADGDISHSDILNAANMSENPSPFLRSFVRIECPDWTMKSFRFDEYGTLPGWAEEAKPEIIALVEATLKKAKTVKISLQRKLNKSTKTTKAQLKEVQEAYCKSRDAIIAEEEEADKRARRTLEKSKSAFKKEQREMKRLFSKNGKQWSKYFEPKDYPEKLFRNFRKAQRKSHDMQSSKLRIAQQKYYANTSALQEQLAKIQHEWRKASVEAYKKIPGFVS